MVQQEIRNLRRLIFDASLSYDRKVVRAERGSEEASGMCHACLLSGRDGKQWLLKSFLLYFSSLRPDLSRVT